MTVAEAIKQLQQLPDNGKLMVTSLGHGGSVPLQGFKDLDIDAELHPDAHHWIDVIYCEDNERSQYL